MGSVLAPSALAAGGASELWDRCASVHKEAPQGSANEVDNEAEPILEGQAHVFLWHHHLPQEESDALLDDYAELNLEQLAADFKHATTRTQLKNTSGITQIKHLSWQNKQKTKLSKGVNLIELAHTRASIIERWRRVGLEKLAWGSVGVIIMAGGEPLVDAGDNSVDADISKIPMQDLGLPSHKSLFRIYCERILRLQKLCERQMELNLDRRKELGVNALCSENMIQRMRLMQHGVDEINKTHIELNQAITIPLYVMVNESNRQEIEQYFYREKYFGLDSLSVQFFQQDTVPLLCNKGQILMKSKGTMWKWPSGSGSLFRSLEAESVFADMKTRGVSDVFVMGCNNLLTHVADPIFIGLCSEVGVEVSVKSYDKVTPEERVRVLCTFEKMVLKEKGRNDLDFAQVLVPRVFAFEDIDEDLLRMRDSGGTKLVFGTADLGQYFFTLKALQKASSIRPNFNQGPHCARLSVPHIALHSGELVSPAPGEKNAVLLKTRVADALEHFKTVLAMGIDRRHELAMCKRVEDLLGALAAFSMVHQGWLQAAGARFIRDRSAGWLKDLRCEVSPLVSYSGEDLLGYTGSEFDLPLNLKACGEPELVEACLDGLGLLEEKSTTFSVIRTKPQTEEQQAWTELIQFRGELDAEGDCDSSQRLCQTPDHLKKDTDHWIHLSTVATQKHFQEIAERTQAAAKALQLDEQMFMRKLKRQALPQKGETVGRRAGQGRGSTSQGSKGSSPRSPRSGPRTDRGHFDGERTGSKSPRKGSISMRSSPRVGRGHFDSEEKGSKSPRTGSKSVRNSRRLGSPRLRSDRAGSKTR